MKKTIILLFLASIFLIEAKAQEEQLKTDAKLPEFKQEIGFAAGFSTGYGLSYRLWPRRLGVQLTAFPMMSNKESYISVGLTGLYQLDASKRYRFFAFLGNHINFQNYDETNYDYSYGFSTNTTTRVNKTLYIVGFGPGIEFTPGGRIGINIMTGFQFQYADKNDWGSYPTIETGIYFRF